MDLEEIKDLLNLMAERGLSEFELERAGMRIHLKRSLNSASGLPGSAAGHNSRAPAESAAGDYPGSSVHPSRLAGARGGYLREPLGEAPVVPEAAPVLEGAREERAAVSTENLHMVKSPIVGTFYEAPAPGADPFVRVGDMVEAGQVLCVIEAMKLMNEIEADEAGEIVERYVSSAQPVEYGEILFAIRPKKQASGPIPFT